METSKTTTKGIIKIPIKRINKNTHKGTIKMKQKTLKSKQWKEKENGRVATKKERWQPLNNIQTKGD